MIRVQQVRESAGANRRQATKAAAIEAVRRIPPVKSRPLEPVAPAPAGPALENRLARQA